MSTTWYIRGARLLDPSPGRPEDGEVRPLLLRNGRIETAPARPPTDATVLDAEGLWMTPGLIDLHVHLREPGDEEAETVASGTRAAAAGGFTCLVSMPNTRPPIDSPLRVRELLEAAASAGFAAVRPAACLTRGRSGQEPADLSALAKAGAACFTDDGSTVPDEALMRQAMTEAARLGRFVMDHAQDPLAERTGVMHEGFWSRRHGLPGIPTAAEVRIIERDIRIAREAGCRLHIQHLTSAAGADAIRAARMEGLAVSTEVTPHHLALCDADVRPGDAAYKMNPPLRSAEDRDALVAALCDGTASCLATDHAPHTAAAKERGFLAAPFGVIGLETAVGVTWTELVRSGRMPASEWVRLWTVGPSGILGLPPPSLEPGAPADVSLFDMDSPWTVDPAHFQSRSRNTCFTGRVLYGRCRATFLGGTRIWPRPASFRSESRT